MALDYPGLKAYSTFHILVYGFLFFNPQTFLSLLGIAFDAAAPNASLVLMLVRILMGINVATRGLVPYVLMRPFQDSHVDSIKRGFLPIGLSHLAELYVFHEFGVRQSVLGINPLVPIAANFGMFLVMLWYNEVDGGPKTPQESNS
eukprot:TRINITY_DN2892_c0_g1_i1.p1 TRINITY_DN2892_c0_g1~~TRINITY_DN2892_c0_g1_i1.p1  ORF type:complete len:158 (+),score=42.45 TRINITY_DN2892_c0_g1_i1:39-476(+)